MQKRTVAVYSVHHLTKTFNFLQRSTIEVKPVMINLMKSGHAFTSNARSKGNVWLFIIISHKSVSSDIAEAWKISSTHQIPAE